MTTREQLGLNANWIPMDSSKSGGSDEFLVKKVNQLEEKVNGLELSGFRVPITDNHEQTSLVVSLAKEDKKVIVTFSLDYANEVSKVKFLYNGKRYTVTVTDEVKFEVPELLDTKLAEYGVHCYYLSMVLDDILISGTDTISVSSYFGNKLKQTDSVDGGRRKVFLELDLKYSDYDASKAKVISGPAGPEMYNEQNRSEAGNIIKLSTDTNVFIIGSSGSGYTHLFLHPDYKSFLVKNSENPEETGKIAGSPKIKTLQVLDIRDGVIIKDEVEFIWKSPDEVLKDNLKPIVVGASTDVYRGVVGKYGYYGNKTGYAVLPYAPNIHNCTSYVYKTDLTEWVGFFTGEGGLFIKNSNKVPSTTSKPFKLFNNYRSDRVESYFLSDAKPSNLNGLLVYRYTSLTADYGVNTQEHIEDVTFRNNVGLVESDFNNNSTYEVWVFSQSAFHTSNVRIINNSLSSLINSETGEFNTAHGDYQKWKNNKCVVHQTLQRVGNEIIVTNLELTTLDVFFKNFIAKSNEWMTKNPSKVEDGSPKGSFVGEWHWDELQDSL